MNDTTSRLSDTDRALIERTIGANVIDLQRAPLGEFLDTVWRYIGPLLNAARDEGRQSSPGPGVSENYDAGPDWKIENDALYKLLLSGTATAEDQQNAAKWLKKYDSSSSEPSPLSAEKIAEIIADKISEHFVHQGITFPLEFGHECANAILALQAPGHQGVGEEVFGDFCLSCASKNIVRIDEMKPGGSFGPSDCFRCVECKNVQRGAPLAQQPSPVSTREGLGASSAESAACVLTDDTDQQRKRDLEYAQRLATVAASHFGPPEGWAPLPDMQGVLSQIDNALTGLTRNSTFAADASLEWVLVPREPSREMWRDAADALMKFGHRLKRNPDSYSQAVWSAMIAATPTLTPKSAIGEGED